MVNTIIKVDLKKPIKNQKGFHNRWHPDIPKFCTVKPDEVFRVECFDAIGCQVKNDDNAIDILETVDLSEAHHLSGPIEIEGAMPGDLIEVELLDIQPLEDWGYTAIFPPERGGSFLCDIFKEAKKAIWDISGIYATSRHIPGVKFVGMIHPGIIGCAPSKELLAEWNKREQELIDSDPKIIPAQAYGPLEQGSILGELEGHPKVKDIKLEAARTIPPRENGGNCDIKNLSRGSKIWLPVFVPGAKLSIGDIHFSQGDGEISFCGAIEMSGAVTLCTKIIKNGMALHGVTKNPIFLPGLVEPRYTKYLTFEGISVDCNGKQHSTCPKISFRNAVLNAIEYFKKFGYSAEQVYMLLSCCPCEGRIASIVDVPNACCTMAVPTEIFDFDVMPREGGHKASPKNQLASAKK